MSMSSIRIRIKHQGPIHQRDQVLVRYVKPRTKTSKSQPKLFPLLVETLHNTLLINTRTTTARGHLAQTENTLHNTQLSSRRIQTRHSQPVINDHTSADDGRTAVHGTSDEGDLQQRGEFVLVADGGFRVHETALVGERHVGSCQDVVGDCLAEDFDAEDVGDAGHKQTISKKKKISSLRESLSPEEKGLNPRWVGSHLLRLPLQIRMHKGNMIIATNHIPQRTQSLLYPLDLDRIGEGIPQMLQLLIRSRCGH